MMKRRNFFALLFGSIAAAITSALVPRKPKPRSAADSPWETQEALLDDVRNGRPVLYRRFKITSIPIFPDDIEITAPVNYNIFDCNQATYIYRAKSAEFMTWQEQMALAA